jgi:lysophospholipase L1-like esterase
MLATRSGRTVEWEVVGQHGATVRRIRYKLLPRLGDNLDLAVLLAGFNDTAARRTVTEWCEDLAAILTELTERARHVVVAGVPPIETVPVLGRTLARYLAERARALDEASRQACSALPRVTWVSLAPRWLPEQNKDMYCEDGLHPSATGYRQIAEAVADAVTL